MVTLGEDIYRVRFDPSTARWIGQRGGVTRLVYKDQGECIARAIERAHAEGCSGVLWFDRTGMVEDWLTWA